jgi:hypothetical protein
MNEEHDLELIRELRDLRTRLVVRLKIASQASDTIKDCVAIIDDACKKHNGLPW